MARRRGLLWIHEIKTPYTVLAGGTPWINDSNLNLFLSKTIFLIPTLILAKPSYSIQDRSKCFTNINSYNEVKRLCFPKRDTVHWTECFFAECHAHSIYRPVKSCMESLAYSDSQLFMLSMKSRKKVNMLLNFLPFFGEPTNENFDKDDIDFIICVQNLLK